MKKLPIRLKTLFDLVPDTNYPLIWDLCCDHGLLGMALADAEKAPQINLVDCVPAIIEKLQRKLDQLASNNAFPARCQAQLLDAGQIVLSQQPQLLIISGVGGLATIELLTQIFANNPGQKPDLLLSPKHHLYAVRQFLIEQDYRLVDEALSFENRRSYENLLVSQNGQQQLTAIGSKQWRLTDSLHQQYLQSLIEHYQKKSEEKIAGEYRLLLSNL